mmetsp:Transcript_81827/g.236492  ORF Transcript_81827/g.236492 Transcript_81827/m.236492 type:complete len:220 (-) Transcript_81827:1383-2042(-)
MCLNLLYRSAPRRPSADRRSFSPAASWPHSNGDRLRGDALRTAVGSVGDDIGNAGVKGNGAGVGAGDASNEGAGEPSNGEVSTGPLAPPPVTDDVVAADAVALGCTAGPSPYRTQMSPSSQNSCSPTKVARKLLPWKSIVMVSLSLAMIFVKVPSSPVIVSPRMHSTTSGVFLCTHLPSMRAGSAAPRSTLGTASRREIQPIGPTGAGLLLEAAGSEAS